jgi:putative phosphoesterase
MRLGVISDTHGHVRFATEAAKMLRALDVQVLIHCGDIGSDEIPAIFEDWPTHYVLGNVDWGDSSLKLAVEAAGHTFHNDFGFLELEGKKIAFLHSHDADRFRRTIASGDYALVCYGHTHVAESHLAGETLVLNPGALYRATPKSFATVDLPEMAVTFHELAEAL